MSKRWMPLMVAVAVLVNLPAYAGDASEEGAGDGQANRRLSPSEREEQCKKEWQRYRESQECFAPYVTVKGSVKAEAFEHCTVVKDPSFDCGAPEQD